MYSSKPNDYPPPPPTSKQDPYGQPVTGLPVNSYGGQAPTPTELQAAGPPQWSTGLCDCFDDPLSCCTTIWCPCIIFGRVAEIVDKGTTPCVTSGTLYFLLLYFTGFGCIYSYCYRVKMRQQYSLPETPCPDFLVHCCCEECALCQEYRELQHRGFDMSIGWEENMARQNGGMMMPPVVPGGMTR